MATDTKELVLVTGASGFLGSYVVRALLESGYRVRGSARSGKLPILKAAFEQDPNFEAVLIQDVAADDITEVLKGVSGIVHVAAPLPGRLDKPGMIEVAIAGNLNILRQGDRAGIKKFVFTSSMAAVVKNGAPFAASWTDDDFNPVTREEVFSDDFPTGGIYGASKTLAEHAVWEYADAHPDLQIIALNPPFIYGPLANLKLYPVPTRSESDISTDAFIYKLLFYNGAPLDPWKAGTPRYVDVRDVAHAHVAALTPRPSPGIKHRRIILCGAGTWFSLKQAVNLIAAERPELKSRLPNVDAFEEPETVGEISTARAKEILGIAEFRHWKDTILAAVDSFVELEKQWGQ